MFQIRRISSGVSGTFGVFMDDLGHPLFVTIEREWLNNKTFVSCIPEGVYSVMRVNTPKHGDCFQVMNVPDRTVILFHKGNIEEDFQGCIGLGCYYGKLNEQPAILNSGKAMGIFHEMVKDRNEFLLKIINCFKEA